MRLWEDSSSILGEKLRGSSSFDCPSSGLNSEHPPGHIRPENKQEVAQDLFETENMNPLLFSPVVLLHVMKHHARHKQVL